ncbi:B3 domain-containing protein [Cephalotus follicularis]|uniref:B3 domain-containing protein n=1 Tax=Cephalotus follicularis TaxID=3775 RepID=A0A1Q3CHQ8_CEPFO|nr:B3 domain-containing protein [Cephalotus follicularis]
MDGTCKECRSWEEDIYWTHFQCFHFSQFLRAGFDHKLVIPEKFIKNLKKKLPETVTLKGPSSVTWNIVITANDDSIYFNHGWEEFVKNHFLEENDILMFKYNGESHFDVLMFDGRSLCEKASSYFVRRCGHTEHDNGPQAKRKNRESSVEVIPTSPECGVVGSPPEKPLNNVDISIPMGQPIITTAATNKRTRSGRNSIKPSHLRQSVASESTYNYAVVVDAKPEAELPPSNKKSGPQYASNRRPVTEGERLNAIRLAQAATTDDGFLTVMKPTYVYKKFYMVIPSGWLTKHLSLENQEVFLRVREKTWHTRFYYIKSRKCGGLASGWKTFAVDNNLEEFDVCVFEPASPASYPLVLDVRIFRVLQEAAPLTQVSPSSVDR